KKLLFSQFFAGFHQVGIEVLNEAVGKPYLGNIDLLGAGPAHGIDIDQQRGNDDVGTVFAQAVYPHAVHEAKTGELFIIIFQQFDVQRLAFLPFGDREYLVDVAAGTDGNDPVGIVTGLSPDIFLHRIPCGHRHLVLEQADGADVEARGKKQLVAGEEGQFRAAAAHIDIEIGVFGVHVFRNMVLVNERGFITAADDLDIDAGFVLYAPDDVL